MRKALLCSVGMLLAMAAYSQKIQNTFSARITDETGAPIVGAHVLAKGNKSEVTTDSTGRFFLKANGNVLRVVVSHSGYQQSEHLLKVGRGEKDLQLEPDETLLEEVVVTATRTPKALKEVPVVTQLLTHDDIKRTDATNVQDLLTEQLPGLEFGYAMSQETSLTMNGFGGNAVLFLVDGERLAGETMNNVDYSRLNLDNVGRIEIVKGASSALYGANAVGGVVNIISRENVEPWTANINSRYKSDSEEWRHGASFSFNKGKWNSQTNAQYSSAKPIVLVDDPFDTKSSIKKVYGGDCLNLKERLVFKASDKSKFIARGSYFNRTSERASYTDHYTDYSGGLKGVFDLGKNKLDLSYGYDQYDKVRYVDDVLTHDHDYSNQQHTTHAVFNMPVAGKHEFTAGADFLHDYLTTYQFEDNEGKSQNSTDVFAQFDYNPASWLNLVGSLRYDYFAASKSGAPTVRLASMFKWKSNSLRASYAQGFRAPTLKEMYMNFDMAGMMMIYGNEDLEPEKSHNFNLALERTGKVGGALRGNYSLTLSGYANRYDKRITTVDFEGDEKREAGSIYSNESGVTVYGSDFNAQYRMACGLGAKFSYNYLYVDGNSMESMFTQPRPHTCTWRFDYDKQVCSAYGFNASLSGRHLSEPKTTRETDGAYSIWKLAVQQRVWKGLNVNFTLDNLFDYRPDVYYYNSAPTTGRTFSLGASLDIDKFCKSERK